MFCNYCGSPNPDAARYCNQCGREIRRSASAPAEPTKPVAVKSNSPQISPAKPALAAGAAKLCPACGLTSPDTTAICKCGFDFSYGGHRPLNASEEAPIVDKWTSVYGWLFLLASFYLLVASLITLIAGPQAIPAFLPLGNATPLAIAVSLLQAALFGATGLAILQAREIAARLVWISAAVSGFGIVIRGLIPLELVLWVAGLGLAIWYSRQGKTTGQAGPATRVAAFALLRNVRVIAVGAGCIAVVIVLINNLQSRSPEHAREKLASLNVPYNARSFLKASMDGDTAVVKLFLQAGMNPNIGLHAAAHGAHPEVVHLLIEKGASVNNRDETGDTPLMDAVMGEDAKEVKLLLELGADPNAPGAEGTEPCGTPLMLAASSGNAELVRLLLSSGANPNAGRDRHTPLSCALNGSKERNAEVVRALLEKGALPSDRTMASLRVKATVPPPRQPAPTRPPPPPTSPQIRVLPSVRLPITVSPQPPARVQPAPYPRQVATIKELPPPLSSALGSAREPISRGGEEGLLGGTISGSPPPPPSPPERIRVGGSVQGAKLIAQSKPDYPPMAKQAQIGGRVRLEAVISKTGTIKDLVVISGHPLLNQAALDAVKKWRYIPTLLNGVPVEVITTVDVNFIAPGRAQ